MLAAAELLVEEAYTDYGAALERHLTVVCRDRDAAQDLAQEAFLRLAREVEAGRTPRNTGAWLHRVGANLAASRGRHLVVADRRSAELPQPAGAPNPEHVLIEAELTADVTKMLAELSGHERHALVLAAYGYGGAEIATSIGRTPGATRTLLCRARSKLRERLLTTGLAPA